MEVNQALELKRELEKNVTRLIKFYEEVTGLCVEGFELEKTRLVGHIRPDTQYVRISVELK